MSAECNLAGLFTPQGSQVWNDELPWQPVPVHTVPLESDHVSNLVISMLQTVPRRLSLGTFWRFVE